MTAAGDMMFDAMGWIVRGAPRINWMDPPPDKWLGCAWRIVKGSTETWIVAQATAPDGDVVTVGFNPRGNLTDGQKKFANDILLSRLVDERTREHAEHW